MGSSNHKHFLCNCTLQLCSGSCPMQNIRQLLRNSSQRGKREYLLLFIEFFRSRTTAWRKNGEPTNRAFAIKQLRSTTMERLFAAISRLPKLLAQIRIVESVVFHSLALIHNASGRISPSNDLAMGSTWLQTPPSATITRKVPTAAEPCFSVMFALERSIDSQPTVSIAQAHLLDTTACTDRSEINSTIPRLWCTSQKQLCLAIS